MSGSGASSAQRLPTAAETTAAYHIPISDKRKSPMVSPELCVDVRYFRDTRVYQYDWGRHPSGCVPPPRPDEDMLVCYCTAASPARTRCIRRAITATWPSSSTSIPAERPCLCSPVWQAYGPGEWFWCSRCQARMPDAHATPRPCSPRPAKRTTSSGRRSGGSRWSSAAGFSAR